jgi:hypothetical protein
MSGLRYFDDMVHEQIRIERAAREYAAKCEIAREEFGPANNGGRASQYWHQAIEGLCAVRIITGRN